MMDGIEDDSVMEEEDMQAKDRTATSASVDLHTDTSLVVDISDALSEKDCVKFSVHTKTTLSEFDKPEFTVVRQHEEFVWLHDRFSENDEYAGVIIPPAPSKPNFDASRQKLQMLGEGEGSMTKEEFGKMKQELEAEYLAIFKKTVAMHEVFLTRIASHPKLRENENFRVFLQFSQDLCARQRTKKEQIGSFFSSVSKKADEKIILSGLKEVDEFFEKEKTFLVEYHEKIREATGKADRATKLHKEVADCYIKISTGLVTVSTIENTELTRIFNAVAECFEKVRKLEGRQASDSDLKLSDVLRYYYKDSGAALDLLYRRSKALAQFDNANKALDKVKAKGKDVSGAQTTRETAQTKYEKITEVARGELTDFKARRLQHCRKNLVDQAEYQLKHSRAKVQVLRNCIGLLKGE